MSTTRSCGPWRRLARSHLSRHTLLTAVRVAQRVPTYDDFHQMVLGADLKPMVRRPEPSSLGTGAPSRLRSVPRGFD